MRGGVGSLVGTSGLRTWLCFVKVCLRVVCRCREVCMWEVECVGGRGSLVPGHWESLFLVGERGTIVPLLRSADSAP